MINRVYFDSFLSLSLYIFSFFSQERERERERPFVFCKRKKVEACNSLSMVEMIDII